VINDPAKVGFFDCYYKFVHILIFFNFLKSFKMSNLVKFLIVVFVTTASLAIYSCTKETSSTKEATEATSELQTRTTGLCESAAGGCGGSYVTKTYIIPEGTPSYPNCEFNVTLRVRWCAGNVDVIYIGFGFNGNDPDCNQFDIDTDNPLIAEQVIEQVEKDLIKAGTLRAVLDVDSNNPTQQLPICGVAPAVNVSLFQSACNKYCLVKTKNPKPGDSNSGYKIVVIPCGDSCCKSVNEICFDSNTGEIHIKEISKVTPATPCTVTNNIPCPFGTVFSSTCRPACASIGQGG